MEDVLKLYAAKDNLKIAQYWQLRTESLLKSEDYAQLSASLGAFTRFCNKYGLIE
jgi:hypothetical protein